jgi:hypothetical protein
MAVRTFFFIFLLHLHNLLFEKAREGSAIDAQKHFRAEGRPCLALTQRRVDGAGLGKGALGADRGHGHLPPSQSEVGEKRPRRFFAAPELVVVDLRPVHPIVDLQALLDVLAVLCRQIQGIPVQSIIRVL